jgi:hypothetical protein
VRTNQSLEGLSESFLKVHRVFLKSARSSMGQIKVSPNYFETVNPK